MSPSRPPQSTSLSSSPPSLYRSPAIKSIAIFPAFFPDCVVDQAAEVGVDCPCKHWLTSHTSDAWTFLGVPVGQCAPHASLFSISITFPQSNVSTTNPKHVICSLCAGDASHAAVTAQVTQVDPMENVSLAIHCGKPAATRHASFASVCLLDRCCSDHRRLYSSSLSMFSDDIRPGFANYF